MKLEVLQKAMFDAMKAGDKDRKDAISSLVSAAKKVGIDNQIREEIPEKFVDQVILKEVKTLKEMIATCPESRSDLKDSYTKRLGIVKEFAPVQIESEDDIRAFISGLGIEITKKNHGAIMAQLRGKADMKIANAVLKSMEV